MRYTTLQRKILFSCRQYCMKQIYTPLSFFTIRFDVICEFCTSYSPLSSLLDTIFCVDIEKYEPDIVLIDFAVNDMGPPKLMEALIRKTLSMKSKPIVLLVRRHIFLWNVFDGFRHFSVLVSVIFLTDFTYYLPGYLYFTTLNYLYPTQLKAIMK